MHMINFKIKQLENMCWDFIKDKEEEEHGLHSLKEEEKEEEENCIEYYIHTLFSCLA